MAGSSGGGSGGGVPPGFRFHPTDEELLHFYLKKKISFQKFDMEVIREVDLNKIEPWELQERCKIGSTPQNEWYFFSHKDRKYPTGSRTNRATSAGFWKATGRDKCIRNSFKKMGMRKTLVFYRGRAPHGQKTDWIMHEYRLEDSTADPTPHHEDGWVICRVFKKKNLFKIGGSNGGGDQHHHHHHHSSNGDNNNMMNNGGMMMMMNAADDETATSRIFSSMNHHQYVQAQADLNYAHHIPAVLPNHHHHHQYSTQIEAAQNFISSHKPALMMLSSPNSTYDDHLSATDYNSQQQQSAVTDMVQVKQFMSASTREHDQCESGASPTAGYHGADAADQSLNDWDRLTSSNQINQLSLRSSEMQDFWAYGK